MVCRSAVQTRPFSRSRITAPLPLLYCLLIIILISCRAETANRNQQSSQSQCKRPQPFDRLLLALQWPPGVCYQNIHKTCIVNTDQFLIHGTWPSNSSGSGPEFCCSDRFRSEEITSIQSQLSSKWRTLFQGSGTDESFWRHEWNKHGTCASASAPTLRGLSNYFSQTLKIYDEAHIKDWLKEASIVPVAASAQKSYAATAFHEAIERHTGKRVYLECKRLPRKISPYPILTGIHLCLSPASLQFIDCQSKDDIDCGNGNIVFLTSGGRTSRGTGEWLTGLILLVTAVAAVTHTKKDF